jgi:hypothetical protein
MALETNTSETGPDRSRKNLRHTELPTSSKNDEQKRPVRTDLSENRWLWQKPKPKSES